MKKYLFVFTMLLILGLAGCGKKEESAAGSSPPNWSYGTQANSETNGSSSFDAASSGDGAAFAIPATPETPKVDTTAIWDELNYLAANRPKVLIDCKSCGGSGRTGVPCATCGGSGQIPIPGVTMFAAFTPCSDCRGDGYAICGQCTFGLMNNPDYETESAAWTERRHYLWHQLGYSDEDIRRMEIEEANAILGNTSGSENSYVGGYDGDITGNTVPGICRVCFGTGDCDTCGGDRLYQNPYTGNQLECPNCTDGRCWKCGGTGQDS